MNKNYKCVLFDLDGTIIDSGPDLIDSLNFALQLENFNHIDKNILGSLVGGGAKVMIEKALKHLNEEVNENKLESMISSFLEFYLKNCSIGVLPEVPATCHSPGPACGGCWARGTHRWWALTTRAGAVAICYKKCT